MVLPDLSHNGTLHRQIKPYSRATMSGLTPDTPTPTEIKLHQQSRLLEIAFNSGERFTLPFEFLRVYSPSAEVRGHGPGQETLQVGKKTIDIAKIDPVGQYAVCLTFSDGHDSGIYSWDYFYELGRHQEAYWKAYLLRMEEAGASREPKAENPLKLAAAAPPGGCGSGGGGSGGVH